MMKTRMFFIIPFAIIFLTTFLICDEHNFVIPSDVEAQVDMDDLQKAIVYPDSAIKNKIEGKVIVNVLIDKEGNAKKVIIKSSTNEIFNQASITAIKNIKYKPALNGNGIPVISWLQIPITYKLK